MGSDDSGSDPEVSVLEMARGGRAAAMALQQQRQQQQQYDHAADEGYEYDESMSQEQYEAEETSLEEQEIEEQAEDVEDDEEEEPGEEPLMDPTAIGLKEISNLGKFTVSSHKPGSGVDELRSDNLKLFWQ